MASAWIITRATKSGGRRYRVEYRLGGRESATRYGGSFKRRADADERKRWIIGELAARRVPDLASLAFERDRVVTFTVAAERWLVSRLDASAGTKSQHRNSVNRACRVLGSQPVDKITAHEIAAMIAAMHEEGLKRGYLRKILQATAMTLDHAGVSPNPARDKLIVRLPPDDSEEVVPPAADHVLAAFGLLPSRYRLPLLVLDDSGMRISEAELLVWGDVDEHGRRWRVAKGNAKTRRARWIEPHPAVFDAVLALCPRDDRTPTRRVFERFSGDAFRTQLSRVCTAAGVPVFSPHDLRHRRISLMHLAGRSWAEIGEKVGQRDLRTTSNTYTHVIVDRTELDYAELLSRARTVPTPVPT